MSKKKESRFTYDQLIDFCETDTSICCSKCSTVSGSVYEPYEASEEFFGYGWRATDNYVYCPKCAKKYLKL